jgi:hypothetical protein
MTSLSSSENQNIALEWAIGFFRFHRDEMKRENGERVSLGTVLNGGINVWDAVARLNPDKLDAYAQDVIDGMVANGLGYLVPHLAARLTERGDQVPKPIRDFICSFLRDPAKWQSRDRGPPKIINVRRDILIGAAVMTIAQWNGIAPTRNRAAKGSSASSIVKEALDKTAKLNVTEATVERCWDDFRRMIDVLHETDPGGAFHIGDGLVIANKIVRFDPVASGLPPP